MKKIIYVVAVSIVTLIFLIAGLFDREFLRTYNIKKYLVSDVTVDSSYEGSKLKLDLKAPGNMSTTLYRRKEFSPFELRNYKDSKVEVSIEYECKYWLLAFISVKNIYLNGALQEKCTLVLI